MKDILLAVMILAFFAFGYFMVDRFGRFFNAHRARKERLPAARREVYISEMADKNTETVSEELSLLLNDLSDRDNFEIIICKKADPDMMQFLEQSGCTVEYVPRQ